MKCTVKRRFDGVWYVRPYLGRTPDKKQIRKYKQFPKELSEKEAQAAADAWASTLTVSGEFKTSILPNILDNYSDMRLLRGSSPNSTRTYELFNRYVKRYIGNVSARELTSLDFIYFELNLLKPKDEGGQGLDQNTVRNVHDYLRGAYDFFVEAGICEKNPLLGVKKPKLLVKDAQALNIADFDKLSEQLSAMMVPEELNTHTFRQVLNAFAALLSLIIGARCGEVLAIRRCDVDRTRSEIYIGGTVIEKKGAKPFRRAVTKGRRSRRVPVTQAQLALVDAFLAIVDQMCPNLPSDAPLVTFAGGHLRPSSVSRAFKNIARRLGLPVVFCFHDLRHTNATWLLVGGVELQTVSERLGHANEAITLRVYGHVLPGRSEYAAQVIDDAMRRRIA